VREEKFIQAFGMKIGRRLPGRPKSRWKDNMKMDIEKTPTQTLMYC
jgi:hypothetical protein